MAHFEFAASRPQVVELGRVVDFVAEVHAIRANRTFVPRHERDVVAVGEGGEWDACGGVERGCVHLIGCESSSGMLSQYKPRVRAILVHGDDECPHLIDKRRERDRCTFGAGAVLGGELPT